DPASETPTKRIAASGRFLRVPPRGETGRVPRRPSPGATPALTSSDSITEMELAPAKSPGDSSRRWGSTPPPSSPPTPPSHGASKTTRALSPPPPTAPRTPGPRGPRDPATMSDSMAISDGALQRPNFSDKKPPRVVQGSGSRPALSLPPSDD